MQTQDKYDGDNAWRAFQRITFATINNGGGTFQRETGAEIDLIARYGSGYVVAVQSFGDVDTSPLPTLWERIARVWPTHVAPNVQYVGTWHDGARVCVDGVVVLPESARDIALPLARKHDQDAIFNIRTGQSEYVCERATADDVYAAIRAIVGGTTPEISMYLPRVSVRLLGLSIDDVIERVFGEDAWADDQGPAWSEDNNDPSEVFCIYNDEILPDDQIGAYSYDEESDVLTLWGFYAD